MKCENCGNNEANVKYTEIINGRKTEMHLCEKCSRKLGISSNLDFNMNMDIPSFFGEIFNEYNSLNLMPNFGTLIEEKCNKCGMTYSKFSNIGKFGCQNCYDVFSDRLDPILKSIQGNNRHVGRKAKSLDSEPTENIKFGSNKVSNKKEIEEKSYIQKLKEDLKKAVKEERYEDAAKLRDEINKLDNNK